MSGFKQAPYDKHAVSWCAGAGASAGAVCMCALPISGMGWTRIFWLRWDRRCCNLRIRLNCPGTSRDRTK